MGWGVVVAACGLGAFGSFAPAAGAEALSLEEGRRLCRIYFAAPPDLAAGARDDAFDRLAAAADDGRYDTSSAADVLRLCAELLGVDGATP